MRFYEVTTCFFDNGKVETRLQLVNGGGEPPESTYTEFSKYDEYRDYFRTLKEAEAWREDARNA